ncbi:sulfurtransferase [Tessaracoccus oleiagri]|uniref:Thiosulfate/3-mercaptopyruvate sulfurtransferase n=1 Tax=Tessaracoccus oleiagri TaxID=686624 RepID=A0A1G9L7S0_9ACTN|nr:sulfurtransferase [Tessaracoccus oleiagri]SDL58020.1 thiosulfate/3-mercaptopyruvate sulfurtransferase [Tessaracoccus oleiagri]
MIDPVVTVGWLALQTDVRLVDVRWYLDGRSGADAYAAGHVPGAVFLDLDEWLTATPSPEEGRHPLPGPERFAEGLRRAGIDDDTVVVAYDDAGGATAARLVWLLRVLGHDAALLDGGLQAWPGDLSTEPSVPEPGNFSAQPWPAEAFVGIDDVTGAPFLVDVRAAERYRGETEPVDARAGHVPGAINLPTTGNLGEDGRFLSPDTLKTRYAGVGIHKASEVVAYCGSGVNACHALLAMEHAGLGRGRLYPGSWSQWAATDRPMET